jgi:hypothetical protein
MKPLSSEIKEQLKCFKPSIFINLILVNLGARSACLIMDPGDVNIVHKEFLELNGKNVFTGEEYETLYDFFSMSDEEYENLYEGDFLNIVYSKAYKKLNELINEQQIKLTYEYVHKFYPKLHIYCIWNGCIVSKKPLSKYKVNKANKDEKYLGKLIDYVCYKNYLNYGESTNKVFNMELKFKNDIVEPIHIFGNTFCGPSDLIKFKSLCKKYMKAFTSDKSPIKDIVDSIELYDRY